MPGEGTWTVNPDTGVITFTPEDGFQGDPTPVQYTAQDGDGNQAEPGTVTITYPDVPDISTQAPQGEPVTVTPELDPGMDPTTLQIIDPTTGQPTTEPVVVPGEGTWTVDPNGSITFTPEDGFEGDPTPIEYIGTDSAGNPSLPGTITITTEVPAENPGDGDPGDGDPGDGNPGDGNPGNPGNNNPGNVGINTGVVAD